MSARPDRLDAASLLRHGAIVLVFNTIIGLLLTLTGDGRWDVNLVYSQAIGLSIWLLVDVGRFVMFARSSRPDGWPRGWRTLVLMGVGLPGGYIIGANIGDLYCGCSTFTGWSRAGGTLFNTIVLGIGGSYFFYSRGKDQVRLREIAAAQRDAAESQLKLLESQLEPHMLFNTLANLRVLIGMDPPRAQAMLDRLIAFLRATLSASQKRLHPLSDEFARIGDYLALMQVRMGERLQVELVLPPELASLPVPPLMIQPLVENAIKHGLEPQRGGGRIVIRAERDGDGVRLSVQDTGVGLDLTRTPAEGSGFGLDQVRQRLHTLYADAAAFTLEPFAAGGTVATVRLPLDPPALLEPV